MARQPFIQERVIGSQEIDHTAIFEQDAAQESFDFIQEDRAAVDCCIQGTRGDRASRNQDRPG